MAEAEAELQNPDPATAKSIFEFQALSIDGEVVSLSKYEGFVTYIVNIASQ
jgi:glutathione peroxidase-family protein